jgi:hypothetical protein
MKHKALRLIVIFSLSWTVLFLTGCKSKKVAGTHELNLTFSSSQEYCGGAAPSEEMLKELSTPKILPNTTVYFVKRNDEGNTIEEIPYTTDNKGKLKINLIPHHYYIYSMSQKQLEEMVSKMDDQATECTRQHMHQSAFDFPVFEDIEAKIVIHTRCNPCLPPAP